MRVFHLAFSLIRVPRLFLSLIFWPLCLGVLVVAVETIMAGVVLYQLDKEESDESEEVSDFGRESLIRYYLFGSLQPLPSIKTCRWTGEVNSKSEKSPCVISDYDLTVQVEDPRMFDAWRLEQLFDGQTETIHICRDCRSHLTLRQDEGEWRLDVYHPFALGIYLLARSINERKLSDADKKLGQASALTKFKNGIVLHLPEIPKPLNLIEAQKQAPLILNVTLILLISLMLALRAHRRVLDYFAQNDALLPLVAACGKSTFYNALWLITLMRVAFFLLAAVPLSYLMFSDSEVSKNSMKVFSDPTSAILWGITLLASLCCVTLVGSIGELKHRHSLFSFLYKYLPIALCLGGALLWAGAYVTESAIIDLLRYGVTILPIVGLIPVISTPFFPSSANVLVFHALLSAAVVVFLVKCNSRWFAAHLEEI